MQEEVISALWAICAVLSFGFGFNFWGGLFALKATLDTVCAIRAAVKEIAAEKAARDKP